MREESNFSWRVSKLRREVEFSKGKPLRNLLDQFPCDNNMHQLIHRALVVLEIIELYESVI